MCSVTLKNKKTEGHKTASPQGGGPRVYIRLIPKIFLKSNPKHLTIKNFFVILLKTRGTQMATLKYDIEQAREQMKTRGTKKVLTGTPAQIAVWKRIYGDSVLYNIIHD